MGPARSSLGRCRRTNTRSLDLYGANGDQADLLKIPGGGCKFPSTIQTVEQRMNTLKMEGKEIFKIAVKVMSEATLEAMKRAEYRWIRSSGHSASGQSSYHSIHRRQLGVPEEKMFVNLDRVGNTSAGSIGIALDEAVQTGRIKKGQNIGLGGLWGRDHPGFRRC